MKEVGDFHYEPVPAKKLDEALGKYLRSVSVIGPEYYDNLEFDSPLANNAGRLTTVTEATLDVDYRGDLMIHLSSEKERMWGTVRTSAYEEKGLEQVEKLAELLELEPKEEIDQSQGLCWSDFAGYDDVKQELKQDIVWPRKNPRLYEKMNTGSDHILLYGPPGTGKTLLGKIIANELDSEFRKIDAGEIIHKHVGDSEKAIQEKFKNARTADKDVTLFFDEIDSFGRKRDDANTSTGENIVNTFLSELDGMNDNDSVTAIGATNRPESLDDAFVRSGRFSNQKEIGLPNLESREAIFDLYLKSPGETKGSPADPEIDYRKMAEKVGKVSGADIENIVQDVAGEKINQLVQKNGIDIEKIDYSSYEDELRVTEEDLLKTIEKNFRP